jgi:predicted acyl esterase
VLTYTSEALTQAVEWTGLVRAELAVTSSGRDTDFVVRVCDVYPDGRSLLVVEYARRARYRDGFDHQALALAPGATLPFLLALAVISCR